MQRPPRETTGRRRGCACRDQPVNLQGDAEGAHAETTPWNYRETPRLCMQRPAREQTLPGERDLRETQCSWHLALDPELQNGEERNLHCLSDPVRDIQMAALWIQLLLLVKIKRTLEIWVNPSPIAVVSHSGASWLFCDLMDHSSAGPLGMDFPGKDTGVGCHFLL